METLCEGVPLRNQCVKWVINCCFVEMRRPDIPQEDSKAFGQQERSGNRDDVPVEQVSSRGRERCVDCGAMRMPGQCGADKYQPVGKRRQVVRGIERYTLAEDLHHGG